MTTKQWFLLLIMLSICKAEEVNLNFFQNDYEVKLDIVEYTWFNKSYYNHLYIGLVWYNRTQRAANASIELLVDVGNKVFMSVQAYKMMSNEYRFFPVSFNANTCTEYKKNSFAIRDMLSRSSNFDPCHLTKSFYYINNLVLDYSRFAPHLPSGSYKLVVDFLFNSDSMSRLNVYLRIVDKPINWKRLPVI